MKDVIINQTKTTPFIRMDSTNSHLEIKGHSIMEDVLFFYKPVLLWLDDYPSYNNTSLKVFFSFEYINEHSDTILFDILAKLNKIRQNNIDVQVYWVCKDEDSEIAGMHFKAYFEDIVFLYK